VNRTGLVVIGAAVAIVGYAIVYNGLSMLSVADGGSSPAFPYGGLAIITALIPGAAGKAGKLTGAAAPGAPGGRRGHTGGPRPKGGGLRREGTHLWVAPWRVAAYARSAGFPAHMVPTMVSIAFRESRWDAHAVNRSSGACGLWQLYPCPGEGALDPAANAAGAYAKWKEAGLAPWGGVPV